MRPKDNVEQAIKKKLSFTAGTELHDRILNDVLNAQEKSKKTKSAATEPRIGRIIMKSSITKLAAAALIIIAIVLATNFMNESIPTVSAQEVLAQATKAVANLRSVYIKAQIRTIPHDNFELIRLDYDFVPNEMWKEFDGTPQGKWRIEKPGRIVVMDGQSSLLLIRPNHAAKGTITTGFVGWLKPLLDVDKVLDSEIRLAQEQGSELLLTHQQGLDGKDRLLVSIEALAQGDFTNDWLRNKSISASDNLRIYTFDAETKLLETRNCSVWNFPKMLSGTDSQRNWRTMRNTSKWAPKRQHRLSLKLVLMKIGMNSSSSGLHQQLTSESRITSAE